MVDVTRLVALMEHEVPFHRALGLRIDAVENGRCVVRVPWSDSLTGDPFRPAVHGGVIAALADTAGGLACFSTLHDAGDRLSTVDMRIDYLTPLHGQDLVCEARVLRTGNRIAVARMEIFAGQLGGELAATAQAVYGIQRRDA